MIAGKPRVADVDDQREVTLGVAAGIDDSEFSGPPRIEDPKPVVADADDAGSATEACAQRRHVVEGCVRARWAESDGVKSTAGAPNDERIAAVQCFDRIAADAEHRGPTAPPEIVDRQVAPGRDPEPTARQPPRAGDLAAGERHPPTRVGDDRGLGRKPAVGRDGDGRDRAVAEPEPQSAGPRHDLGRCEVERPPHAAVEASRREIVDDRPAAIDQQRGAVAGDGYRGPQTRQIDGGLARRAAAGLRFESVHGDEIAGRVAGKGAEALRRGQLREIVHRARTVWLQAA